MGVRKISVGCRDAGAAERTAARPGEHQAGAGALRRRPRDAWDATPAFLSHSLFPLRSCFSHHVSHHPFVTAWTLW